MKVNKILAVGLILVVGFLPLLSGCAAPTPQVIEVPKEVVVEKKVIETVEVEKEVAVEKVVTKEVEKVVTATPEPAAPPEPVTITYWHLPDVMDVDLAAKQVEEFEAAYPNIKVKAVPISTETAEEGILAALAAGVPPDVCQMNATEVAKYGQWGALVALDQFADWGEVKKRIPEGAIQTFGGHVYAMPWRTNPVMLFYNKDLFAEAGLDPDKPPATWSELLEAAEALTRPDEGRWAFVAYPGIHKWYRPYFLWHPLYYSATGGAGMIADDGSKAIVNSAGGLQTLEFLQTIYSDYATMDITSYKDAFYQGQGAMLMSGTFMVPRIKDAAPDMDFGMVAVPIPDDGPVDHAITHSDERDIVIFSLSQQQDAAWEFVKFISGPDQAVNLMETTGMYLVLKDLTDYPDVAAYLSQDPFLMAGAEEMNYIRLPVAHPNHQEICATLANELSACLVVGQKTPQQALADAEAKINEILGVPPPTAAPPPTGKITIYTSVPQAIMDTIKADFEVKFPEITLDVFRAGTGAVMAKLAAEMEAGAIAADLLWVAEPSSYEELKDKGVLLQFTPAEAGALPAEFRDPDGYYYAGRLINMIVGYNVDVEPKPTGWKSLLDPAYEGKIGMATPIKSGAALATMAALADHVGSSFYQDMADNGAVQLTSNGKVRDALATGELTVGIVLDYMIRGAKAKGSPVDYVCPEEGTVMIPSPIAIFNTSQNPEAAQVFVDYTLSQDGQKTLVELGNFIPVRADVDPPADTPGMAEIESIPVDWVSVKENTEALKDQFVTIYGE